MSITTHRSPNFDARIGCTGPQLVILHYTGMKSGAEALARLCDPASKVSAHYVVEEDGRVFALIDEAMRAWHAGKSFWRGITDINSHSIGIEIVNPGHEFGYRAFPQKQMDAVLDLCVQIKARYNLSALAFIGHSDIAPARKEDPGELFDWKMLAQSGIGIWPHEINDAALLGGEEAKKLLQEIGYDCSGDMAAVIRAFQRHFVQKKLSGVMDNPTSQALQAIAKLFGA